MANLYNVPLKNAVQKVLQNTLTTAETSTITFTASVTADLQASASIPGILVVDRIDVNGNLTPSATEYISFTGVSGSTVTGLTRGLGGTTAQDHAIGAIVEFVPDVVWADAINDVITTEHDATGEHKITTFSNLNAPEGFLINGKIVPSVASNNLTVALKTLAGTDASATDPIYVRINGVIRTITSALSLSANAGTNYFNMGSAELATKETDLFVYLCWKSSTSEVLIAISRLPYGAQVNNLDLSITAANGCLYSAAGTALTDTIVNIGRFAATLSAGASYNWTVPTFTSSNLIQRPIYETRWLAWTPSTFSASASMTWTSITTFVANYRIESQRIEILLLAVGTTGGTQSYGLRVAPPMAPTTIETVSSMPVKDGGGSEAGAVEWESSNSTLQIRKYNAGNWGIGANRGFWGLTWYRV